MLGVRWNAATTVISIIVRRREAMTGDGEDTNSGEAIANCLWCRWKFAVVLCRDGDATMFAYSARMDISLVKLGTLAAREPT